MTPAWLSISAYSRLYQVDRKTVRKWLDAGLLKTFRVHSVIRVANTPPKTPQSHKVDVK